MTLERRSLHRPLQQRRADASPHVVGVDRELVEVGVGVELAHVGEADRGVTGDEHEAGQRRAVLAGHRRRGQRVTGEVAQRGLEERESCVLDRGQQGQVTSPGGAYVVRGHGTTVDSPGVRLHS